MKAHKFSINADGEQPDILNNRTEREFLESKYTKGCIFGLDNLKRYGCYRFMGWSYDFREFLKLYLIKQGGQWQEEYAPNKTLLRKSTYGRIQKIQELDKEVR